MSTEALDLVLEELFLRFWMDKLNGDRIEKVLLNSYSSENEIVSTKSELNTRKFRTHSTRNTSVRFLDDSKKSRGDARGGEGIVQTLIIGVIVTLCIPLSPAKFDTIVSIDFERFSATLYQVKWEKKWSCGFVP